MTLPLITSSSPPPLPLPCLQYPLYSASIQLYGGQLLPYNLKEEAGWGLDLAETRRTVQEARWGLCREQSIRAWAGVGEGIFV